MNQLATKEAYLLMTPHLAYYYPPRMKYESNTIKSVVLSLLFSASYEIRKENYQISSSFLFFRLGNRQFANSLMCLRTWLWRNDGIEPEIEMLQILHVCTTEHAKISNESFIMIGTLGEELWRNVPDFWPFSAVFSLQLQNLRCAFGWFFSCKVQIH